MSTDGYPHLPAATRPLEGGVFDILAAERIHPRHRYWLHALLLLLTLVSTTVVGAGLAHSFAAGRIFDFDLGLEGYKFMWSDPSYLLDGLPFSLTLLVILLTHEMGHYLAARYYLVDATLPFFIPVPNLIGTFGAFIRIRSAILSKRILFDIGIAGPLGGFGMLILPLIAGVSMSHISPGVGARGELIFGTPLILRFFEWAILHARPEDVYLHPVARAAWVGLLATALNLLPIGQLDGGHILYAFLGEWTRVLSRAFIGVLVVMGFFFAWSWFFWAGLLFFFGLRHPVIIDPTPLSPKRRWLGLAALVILILSFTLTPIRSGL
ncbi:MAG TPA: site-2 protease family protein [Bryobacteraceae bacterium]|nr:site-2 protease family protein [Bryobacteraceae bacterium]